MSRFYLLLWLRWLTRLTLCSLALASVFSLLVTVFIYVNQGTQSLNAEVWLALFEIFKFWFVVLWSLTLLIALFRSLKYVFNSCANGYELILLSCKSKSEYISPVGYGDLIKVWRKWLTLMIWLVGAQMIVALIFTALFTAYDAIFDWFNIYVLYVFVLLAGYFSFTFLSARCKLVKVRKC